MADYIKCGRNVFELVDDDTILDNGSCYQLITRKVGVGFDRNTPVVSKAEFKKFSKLTNISITNRNDSYIEMHLTEYRYNAKRADP